MSISEYLRQVVFWMPIKSIIYHQSIADLAKVNADQGRLGGLLKLWLTNNEKLKSYDRAKLSMNIIKLLEEIKRLQALPFNTPPQCHPTQRNSAAAGRAHITAMQ
ncbi:MAG: hypothetical protein NTX45_30280 [Proteobacteria bacterium]|nr:hypothetical protein [Pseudomonadota bacterium]